MRRRFVWAAGFTLLATLSACWNDDSPTVNGLRFIGLPTPTPTSLATPLGLTLSPETLSFTNVGAAYAQTVNVSEAGYSVASTCAGVATILLAANAITVTPVAAGTCGITVSANGSSGTISVTVTQTTVGGS